MNPSKDACVGILVEDFSRADEISTVEGLDSHCAGQRTRNEPAHRGMPEAAIDQIADFKQDCQRQDKRPDRLRAASSVWSW